jgi:hypothetical protein
MFVAEDRITNYCNNTWCAIFVLQMSSLLLIYVRRNIPNV